MNEKINALMCYGGFILSGIFLILAFILFFYNRVYASFSFLANRGKTVTTKKRKSKPVTHKPIKLQEDPVEDQETMPLAPSEDYTEILCDDDATEILD